jgi:PAS domain-containing protein
MDEGVISLAADGRITIFNPAAAEILGIDGAKCLGRRFAEIFLERPGGDDFAQVVLDAIYDKSRAHQQTVSYSVHGMPRTLRVTQVSSGAWISSLPTGQ